MAQLQTKFIADASITNAKLAQVPANTLKGNNTGSAGVALDLTTSQVVTLLGVMTSLTGDVTATGPGASAASLVATSNGTLVTLSALTTASSLASIGTVTTGTWNATTITPTHGGTGLAAYTTGDTLYASASNVLSKLSIGTTGQVYAVSAGGIPSWVTPATGITTIGTINSQTAAANGLVISGSSLYAQFATTTNPGMVSLSASGAIVATLGVASVAVDGTTVKITSNALEAIQPHEERITLSGTNITNQYVDLAFPIFGASASNNSATLWVAGGPMQLKTVDYTVSLTGGTAGVTRISFAGDLATGGAAALVATDILVINYSYLA